MKTKLVALLAIAFLAMPVFGSMQATVNAQATPEPAADVLPPIVWEWTAFIDAKAGEVPVLHPDRYTVQFLPSGRMYVLADCNRGAGTFSIDGASVTIEPIATTMMMCPPLSRDFEFLQALEQVAVWSINNDLASDTLVLDLMADGGTMLFRPALTGVEWRWQKFQGGDGALTVPSDPAAYTLNFNDDGTVTGKVSCNRGAGQYTVDGNSITIVMATTRMFCPDAPLDSEYGRLLSDVNSFVIRNGNLSLALPIDSGIMTFAPYLPEDEMATPEAAG